MARGQRAPHRTVRLRQLMRARCPTLRIFCCWEGGARRCLAVPASLLRRIGARALSADPRTRHASRRRRPRVIRILQARTRPALVPRTEAAALFRGIPRAAVRPPVNLRVAARLQAARRAAMLLRRHRANRNPTRSRLSPLRPEAGSRGYGAAHMQHLAQRTRRAQGGGREGVPMRRRLRAPLHDAPAAAAHRSGPDGFEPAARSASWQIPT